MAIDTDLITLLKSNAPVLRSLGVTSLAIFGSRARGDFEQASDLDVLVDMDTAGMQDRIKSGRAALAVSGTLSEITGLDISLLTKDSLSPTLAGRISDDIVQVF